MVRPCKECENEHKQCEGCNDFWEWLLLTTDQMDEVSEDVYERQNEVPHITYREIVFNTIFTRLWR